jgi:hypothetical protein
MLLTIDALKIDFLVVDGIELDVFGARPKKPSADVPTFFAMFVYSLV